MGRGAFNFGKSLGFAASGRSALSPALIVGAMALSACATNSQKQASAAGAGGGIGGGTTTGGTGGYAGATADSGKDAWPVNPATTQMLTVITDSWTGVPATLQRYQTAGSDWAPVGEPVPVVVGKSGLGWGRGLVAAPSDGGPVKQEGDGRAPAGIFLLASVFGYAPPDQATWVSMPYVHATADLECVDDPASSHYNTLVAKSGVANVDWKSSETMKRNDALYRWGVFVNHNTSPTVAGAGSCIFLHLWRGPKSSTVGCTAGEEAKMKEVFGWLDPKKEPVVVQLPRAVYDAQRSAWSLP